MNVLAGLYADKAEKLRKRAVAFAEPYVGGISETEKDIFEEDTDLIQPAFEKGIHDNE